MDTTAALLINNGLWVICVSFLIAYLINQVTK